MRTPTVAEILWQAGMFEGEGSIRINKPTRRNWGALLVDLVNTDEGIVREFHEAWGGSVHASTPEVPRKPFWRWRASSIMARDFLLAIWPCLHTDKYRARAVLGIDFQDQKRAANAIRWAASDDKLAYIERQLWFYERMKVLNIRGRSNADQHRRER